jgi:hypothetical protein
MTADTTFREFVEKTGIRPSMLKVGSQEYWDLIEAFNGTSVKLRTEAKNVEHEEARARRCFRIVFPNQ